MAEFWRTKGFKSLSKEWDERLKLSGFEDAETEVKGDRFLRQNATNCYRQASELERSTRLEYFTVLSGYSQLTDFECDIERLIMLRHSEGFTNKEIIEELESLGVSRHRETIRHIIRRWQNKWGVRTWSLKEMNLK